MDMSQFYTPNWNGTVTVNPAFQQQAANAGYTRIANPNFRDPEFNLTDPQRLKGWTDYFNTHYPAEWQNQPTMQNLFSQIYGQDALQPTLAAGATKPTLTPILNAQNVSSMIPAAPAINNTPLFQAGGGGITQGTADLLGMGYTAQAAPQMVNATATPTATTNATPTASTTPSNITAAPRTQQNLSNTAITPQGAPTSNGVQYYNASGQPYSDASKATPSYWWNPTEGTWYQGTNTGQITNVGANAPWQTTSNAGGGSSGTGTATGGTAYSPTTYQIPTTYGASQGMNNPWTNYADYTNTNFFPDYGSNSYGTVLSQMLMMANPALANAINQNMNIGNNLGSQLMSTFPVNATTNAETAANQIGNTASGLTDASYQGTMNYLAQLYPQLFNALGSAGGNTDVANALLGGTGTGYGVADLYNQLMQQGLPNQQAITEQTAGQSTTGQGAQQSALDQLQTMIANGGLTPEYVQAQKDLILNPQLEQLATTNNQMGGGIMSPESGLYQELARRATSDFNNQLISTGYGNLLNAIGQTSGLGQNALSNALTGYNTQNQIGATYANQMGNLATALLGQGTNALGTLTNSALSPYTTGLSGLNTSAGLNTGLQGNIANQLINLMGQFNTMAGQGYGQQANVAQLLTALESDPGILGTILNVIGNSAGNILGGYFGGKAGGK